MYMITFILKLDDGFMQLGRIEMNHIPHYDPHYDPIITCNLLLLLSDHLCVSENSNSFDSTTSDR